MFRSSLRECLRDFRRDVERNRGMWARMFLLNFRVGSLAYRVGTPRLLSTFLIAGNKIGHNILSIPLGGGELHARCRIGGGLSLPHRLNGIVIHPATIIGSDVTIYHQVTIGRTGYIEGKPQVPRIGDGVTIYPGAKILGPIEIGAGAVVGANAVVIHSVAPGAVVLTSPAQAIVEPAMITETDAVMRR